MASADTFTPEWIVGQRWFRSKQRPIATVRQVDRAPLGAGGARLAVLAVTYTDGGENDLYLVPSIHGREPRDGEGAWAELVRAIAGETELAGTHGVFRCSRTDALGALLTHDLTERRLAVEQSNTSVMIGKRLILKLYRLLEPGVNPELEVSAFLTDAGFADTPTLAGSITYESDGVACTGAMLQQLVPASGDAWSTMLAALASDPGSGVRQSEEIGRVTARLHAALASLPEDPAFPARAASVQEAAAWRTSAERGLAQAVTAVTGDAHERLVALAPLVMARFADTFTSASGEARVTRIHGDYHLGQLLARPGGGYSVIDFEGEPARPLAERRRPSSPLRDVAGMLRSLDYAARAAEREGLDSQAWRMEARNAFVNGYGGIGLDEVPLLRAFELERACYEVRYEAGNRPDLLRLPLAAVERLARSGHAS